MNAATAVASKKPRTIGTARMPGPLTAPTRPCAKYCAKFSACAGTAEVVRAATDVTVASTAARCACRLLRGSAAVMDGPRCARHAFADAGGVEERGKGGGVFNSCLPFKRLTIDYARLSKRSGVPTHKKDTTNIWARFPCSPYIRGGGRARSGVRVWGGVEGGRSDLSRGGGGGLAVRTRVKAYRRHAIMSKHLASLQRSGGPTVFLQRLENGTQLGYYHCNGS